MDLTTISAALGGIKTANDIAKAIKDAGLSVEQAEIKLKIAELISALSDAKMGVAEIREQLQQKDEEIAELKTQLKLQDSLNYEAPYYWLKQEGKVGGPFCQLCYDKEKKLIRLQEGRTGMWTCNSCKSHVKDSSYSPPKQKSVTIRNGW